MVEMEAAALVIDAAAAIDSNETARTWGAGRHRKLRMHPLA